MRSFIDIPLLALEIRLIVNQVIRNKLYETFDENSKMKTN